MSLFKIIYKNTPVCIGAIQLLPVGIDRPLMQRAFYFMENEIWKPVSGFEGYYEVSSLGKVASLPYRRRCVRKPSINSSGYLSIILYKPKFMKTMSIHRLIAVAFVANPENKPQVNHKDENKLNNDISNLEWCTPSHNTRHAISVGLMKPNNKRCPVEQLTISGQLIALHKSVRQAALSVSGTPQQVSRSCKINKQYNGYMWRKHFT